MRTIWISVLIIIVFLTGTKESTSQTFYVTTCDSIFVVDAGSCKARWLCTTSGFCSEEIASYKNVLYGYSQSTTQLYSIDTTNGTASSVICSHAGLSNSLTCDQEGNFYEANDYALMKIPISDPWPQNIGQFFSYSPAGDLAFLNNHLYVAARDYYASYLVSIDLNPYGTTLVGPMNIGSHWVYGLFTSFYMNKLSLLGTTDENKLYVIDEVTGNATFICDIPVSNMILGAASKETGASVPNDLTSQSMKIYPALIKEKLIIETGYNLKEAVLSLLNLNGQEIIQQKIHDRITQLNLGNLANGMYLVRLTTDNKTEVKKIIKE